MIFNKELLETIFSHQTSFMYILDRDLRVIFASRPLLKYMQRTESELMGKTIEEIGYAPDTVKKLNALFHRVLKGETTSGEDIFSTINGVDIYFEYTFAPIKNAEAEVTGVSAVCRDVTDRKKMKDELTQSVVALQKERELREHFVMAMTHDLRTPLTAAKLSAQIIQKHPQDEVAIQKFSTRIIENVERTDIMIRDLLDSLRLKAGEGISLNLEVCVLNALLESLVENLITIHGSRFKIVMNEMIKSKVDKQAMRRLIENLLTNAIKYGAPDKMITIHLYKEGSMNFISVHNEGEALAPHEISDLFIPFKRTQGAQKSGQKGWGLGLTLVMGIAEAHKGSVKVLSTPEKGTTFTVSFPQL